MRTAPQDLPSSRFLLTLTLSVYALIGICVSLLTLGPVASVISAFVDMGVLIGLTQLVLWIKDLGPRFTQTATALAGTGAIITLIALPFLVVQSQVGEDARFLPSVVVLVLMVWNLNIVGHILCHALSAKKWVGLGLAIVYMYVSISVFRAFVGPIS